MQKCEAFLCGRDAEFQCSNCKMTKYCSRECQRFDYVNHKAFCKEYGTLLKEMNIVGPLSDPEILGIHIPVFTELQKLYKNNNEYSSDESPIYMKNGDLYHRATHKHIVPMLNYSAEKGMRSSEKLTKLCEQYGRGFLHRETFWVFKDNDKLIVYDFLTDTTQVYDTNVDNYLQSMPQCLQNALKK